MTKEEISKLSGVYLQEKYFKQRWPEDYERISKLTPPNFSEKIYWYIHNLEDYPRCPQCGSQTKFIRISQGYHKFCSQKCAGQYPETQQKLSKTNNERYGCKAPIQNSKILKKYKKTMVERYGAECPFHSEDIKRKIVNSFISRYGVTNVGNIESCREKIKKTQIEKYGGVAMGSQIIREKIENTNLLKYGYKNPMCVQNIIEKAQNTLRIRYGGSGYASPSIKQKIDETMVGRWGVLYATQNPKIMQHVKDSMVSRYGGIGYAVPTLHERAHKTSKIRYGNPHYSNILQSISTQTERYGGVGMASQDIKLKKEQTCLELYGDPHYMNPVQIRETMLKRYGVTSFSKTDEFRTIVSKKLRTREINRHENLIGYTEDGKQIIKCPHLDCNKCTEKYYIISTSAKINRTYQHTEPCTRLLPIQPSISSGTSIELFVRDILDKHNIHYETNVRILDGKEIDIYVPDKKIGIECNGIHWHSTRIKPRNYHMGKYLLAKSMDIHLITLWEDQIIRTPHIVESILLNKLGLCKETIFARNCEIKDVDSCDSRKFLEENHLQGATPTSLRYGLYSDSRLVALMTFTRSTPCSGKKGESTWNLNRFCTLAGVRVVGGASRLLAHFEREQHPDAVVSYSHNDISDGHLYERLGFKSTSKSQTSYYWVSPEMERWHRSSFTRARIQQLGWAPENEAWTERGVMESRKFHQVYDAGTTRWDKIYKR